MLPAFNTSIGVPPLAVLAQETTFNNNNNDDDCMPGVCEGFPRVESIPEMQMCEDSQTGSEDCMLTGDNPSDDTVMLQNDGCNNVNGCEPVTNVVTDRCEVSSNINNNTCNFSGHPSLYNNGYQPFVTFNNQLPCNNNSNSLPSFTFTTPTQSVLHSPALTSIPPARYQNSGTSAHTFSPTVCTPWQHSAPVRIPWAATSLNMTVSSQGVSLFTAPLSAGPLQASMEPTYCLSPSVTSFSSPMCSKSRRHNPAPSCSRTPRRPKRPSSENIDLLSPTNKVHLTEEKIAAHMQELNISGLSPPLQAGSLSPLQAGSLSPLQAGSLSPLLAGSLSPLQAGTQLPLQTGSLSDSPRDAVTGSQYRNTQLPDIVDHTPLMTGADKGFRSLTQDQQWQTYNDLEERLDISDDDTPESERDYKKGARPKLHIVSDIGRIPRSEPVIPAEILKELRRFRHKPRLEIVLWTPPGNLVKNAISSTTQESVAPLVKSTSKQTPDLVKTHRLLGDIQEDSYMETDMVQDSLDL